MDEEQTTWSTAETIIEQIGRIESLYTLNICRERIVGQRYSNPNINEENYVLVWKSMHLKAREVERIWNKYRKTFVKR